MFVLAALSGTTHAGSPCIPTLTFQVQRGAYRSPDPSLANSEYLDRNYGGVLIIFDRLFGTYAEEQSDRSITYGLTHPLNSYNPVTIAFYEWGRLFQNLQGAKTWGDRYQVIMGRPT